MRKLTKKDFKHACYDPFTGAVRKEIEGTEAAVYLDKGQDYTALDILEVKGPPARDKLAVMLMAGESWLNEKELAAVRKVLVRQAEIKKDLPIMTLVTKAIKKRGADVVLKAVIRCLTKFK